MKFLATAIIFVIICSLVPAALDDTDLAKIENMILQSEKRIMERVDEKIESLRQEFKSDLDRKTNKVLWLVGILNGFVIILLSVPQISNAIAGRRERKAESREIADIKERLARLESTKS